MRPTTLRNGLLGMKNGDVGLSLDDVRDGGMAVGVAMGGGWFSLRLPSGVSGRDGGREEEGVAVLEVSSGLEIVESTLSSLVNNSGLISV